MSGSKTSFLVLFALALAVSSSHAQSTSTLKSNEAVPVRQFNGEWAFEIGGESYSEDKDQGTAAYLYLNFNFEYKFTSWLRAKARPHVDGYSSRLQERFETDDYKNGVKLTEAYISLQPVDFAELRGGALNQGYLNSPMLISARRSFPGFQEILIHQFANLRIEGSAAQVVPVSTSLNDEREDKEKLPLFQTQSIQLSGKNFSWLEWRGNVGHYSWAGMPNKVAYESEILGNSPDGGEAVPGAQFKYAFDGVFAGVDFCLCFVESPLQWTGEFQRVRNARAASGFGDAQLIGTGPRIIMGDRVLDIRYRRYFVESDVTVASYNRAMFGHSNRIGDNVQVRLDFKDAKFAIVGEWDGAQTLIDRPLQKSMTQYYIGVETHYAPFF